MRQITIFKLQRNSYSQYCHNIDKIRDKNQFRIQDQESFLLALDDCAIQLQTYYKRMPKIKTLRSYKAPKGFEELEPVLEQFQKQMKDAQNAPLDAQTKKEQYWKIMRLHHQRSRYIYDLFYNKQQISRQLYDFLLRQKYAEASLIAKWKKNGYQKLCCLACIYSKEANYKNVCICRVPRTDLEEGKLVMCEKCGCRGCSSTD